MLGPFLKAQLRSCTHRSVYSGSFLTKISNMIQGILNSMANEDYRKFDKESLQNNLPIQPSPPKSEIEQQNQYTDSKKVVSLYEAKRLQRIDKILGTRTYFHETKIYEERIDTDNVMIVRNIYQKYQPKTREEVDLLNPQINEGRKLRRRQVSQMKALSQCPQGGYNIKNFEDAGPKAEQGDQKLVKFLAAEQLYSRLALAELDLVMKSIQQQKITRSDEQAGVLLNSSEDTHFVFGKYTYFFVEDPMSVYRIQSAHYSSKLLQQSELMAAIGSRRGSIQEVVTINEIYECLQQYYYDDRVNDYLGRVENGELGAFLHDIHISPDGRGIMVVIDLLGTSKQYAALFKVIDEANENNYGILNENVVFNIQPAVALRNEGEAYYVQRSTEGMFIELVKSKFSNYAAPTRPDPTTQKQITQEQKEKVPQVQRQEQILYKCEPHKILSLVANAQARYVQKDTQYMSENILLNQTQIGEGYGNKIYLLRHEPGLFSQSKMQEITKNNSNMSPIFEKHSAKQKYSHIDWNTEQGQKWLSQCFQVMDVGYLVVRYSPVYAGEKQYLKYGVHPNYGRYVTLVPYARSSHNKQTDQQIEYKPQQARPALEAKNSALSVPNTIVQAQTGYTQLQISLPQTPQLAPLSIELDHSREQFVFVCPAQQFFVDARVKHANISNVYLIMNLSVQSFYNRNCLHFHPLRRHVTPYSLYLDGYYINLDDRVGLSSQVRLRLQAPLLPVDLEYTLWKKQLKEKVRERIYTETIAINQLTEDEIILKVVSNRNFIKRSPGSKHESQPVILHIPSRQETIDELLLEKTLEKGVIFVEIVKARGVFGTNMIDLVRGTKQNYRNYIEDIKQAILFIRENIGDYVSVYAQGEVSCFATLLLNIYHNRHNQLFQATVLHGGLYDISQASLQSQHFFGPDPYKSLNCNPFQFFIYNPTARHQVGKEGLVDRERIIYVLSNIVFSNLPDCRAQSRKFINKLRSVDYNTFPDIFLKEHHSEYDKDLFNLSYLYANMRDAMKADYEKHRKQQMEDLYQEGEMISRDSDDKERKLKRVNNNEQ